MCFPILQFKHAVNSENVVLSADFKPSSEHNLLPNRLYNQCKLPW